jgi:hypothetical protein
MLPKEDVVCSSSARLAVSEIGAPTVDENVAYPCISIAASSHLSLALAVQAHDTEPGDACAFELDAPVTAPGMLIAQLFAQVGEPSVTSPYIEVDSSTLLLGNCVVIDTPGVPEVPWAVALVGIGLVWSTPDKAYAPTTTEVAPVIDTTMFAVPDGFVRYQNSASSLTKDCTPPVSCAPPNVTEATYWLFASTPTTSRRLLPAPALNDESVT